ncbi:Peroxisomal fatty acid beta-oxidation pathway [Komagataella phaffii CBS 7435]|uniref:Multifunctional enzyme of the peroxisomal fatty acid beta-oxidation pathway n=2 Tax=Komagataella phaffii TaxID=460519 RepID=C4R1Q7_KOMPG|nr:Multifunctional enzyme of the peroxisomal fatty acid beta-oxidation pathway [Komagataella phaffii GS115]AOA62764.1 GQ67_00847T0 [Komagataella phaffii]CAH2448030.1 Peroxisomal fatty acid beta-oxidation pathway [Komagataella phaffii CBS 7435]AOA67380.1 GQ68_00542T0 [Komagataella phaffii GS115]CAY69431.1 Multifunctional enzyme of the peroxisomal fatty acid beta-oxidation pathway [Komagataella phaffii GS115]CCA38183.1 Peroxisomal fatty acid beta-oxidation pathway [Komagataella phaffii CBS 7435]
MSQLRFDNKVVVITGAGGGLGKEYALQFASRGAKVVVNDLGGTLGGAGTSSRAADLVVANIKEAGGEAVANYDNVVLNPEGIIDTAIKSFGAIHVLVNNAGILNDSSFKKMTEEQFQQVIDVHLTGAFKLTKYAWKFFKQQKYGRIINTASPAGLYGNFGQANYSAAKLALVALAETLAKEGQKYNIKVNAIAPLARSRMTEAILPEDILEKLGPDKVAPLVLLLGHDMVPSTGGIFEVAAGFYGQITWQRSGGSYFNPNDSYTPEAILHKWNELTTFEKGSQSSYPRELKDYESAFKKASRMPIENSQGKVTINSLKEKVVLITGAGSGLGRSHALWFARYGAIVIVNDFKDPFTVVQEIKEAGGKAYPSKHDVVKEPEKIINEICEKFGRIHVLVNNAGILRDRSFLKMSEQEWNQVYQVHLLATFKLCKLVWPIFLKQNAGVIINTTSTSGIYGNFGQANYAASKAGVLGLSRTLAIEGKKHNIHVNTIAPHAATSMTKTIMSEKELDLFPPSQVSPLVVLLASSELGISGELFEVGGGWIGKTRWKRASGIVCNDSKPSPEFILKNWSAVTDVQNGIPISSTQESSMAILSATRNEDEEESEDDNLDDVDDDDEKEAKVSSYKFNHRDVILYNLGVGSHANESRYVYEGDEDFQPVPSFGVIPFMVQDDGGLNMESLLNNFNPMMLLHGEQYLKLNKIPLPTSGDLVTKSYPIAVENKGKNALVVAGYETIDKVTKETVFYNEGSFFVRGSQSMVGNKVFRQSRSKFATQSFNPPSRRPDFESILDTSFDQAAIYRLSGDFNPLHIDPGFAKGANFDKPILHGLCSFGISVKKLVDTFGIFDEAKCRFSNVVYPGEKLRLKVWKDGNELLVFQTFSVERNVVVISNAAVKLAKDKFKL